MAKRVFLIVLDSFGCGALPDADKFGDAGTDTLRAIAGSDCFRAENLLSLGLGNIPGVDCLDPVSKPRGAYGKLREASAGKDTVIGHWEISGLISRQPLPVYPDGFPDEIISEFSRLTGREVLCNRPYSGTEVLKVYGKEHIETGKLIVYTSADSVFQIAAHEDTVPVEQLYEYCRIARKILAGKHGVGRVIARPFAGEAPDFYRTPKRHDFALEPTGKTMLDILSGKGYDVISVGKIYDIFAGRGITESYYTRSNREGMETALRLADKDFRGLCFVNLVDFDMLYGHRRDVDGYAKAIAEFDAWLPEFIGKMKYDDILILTGDHGCDPSYLESTDHTREYTPLIMYGESVKPENYGIRETFADIGAEILYRLGVDKESASISGKPFSEDI